MAMLTAVYPWIKAFHILAVIAWMAAVLYLPRLYMYHMQSGAADSVSHELFVVMERRLLQIIATPAMLMVWLFGLAMMMIPGLVDWSAFWPWGKAAGIVAMTWFHFWLAARRKELAEGRCSVSANRFRMMNEIPTVLAVIIVIFVVVKPF